MVKYRREISEDLESLDVNAFDATIDTMKLDIEKAEDVAFTDADKGIVVMAVRDDTPPTAKGANNDYMPLLVDATGQLYVIGAHDLAIKNAIEIVDDWDESDRCKVNLNIATSATSTGVTAGATSVQVLAANASRKFVVIVNDSNETVYLKLGETAALHSGIRLNAAGGAFEINATNLYTGRIDAIASNANKVLTVTEG